MQTNKIMNVIYVDFWWSIKHLNMHTYYVLYPYKINTIKIFNNFLQFKLISMCFYTV